MFINPKEILKSLSIIASAVLAMETCELSAGPEASQKVVSSSGKETDAKHMQDESKKPAISSRDPALVKDSPFCEDAMKIFDEEVTKKSEEPLNEEAKDLVIVQLIPALENGVKSEELKKLAAKMYRQVVDFSKISGSLSDLKDKEGKYDNDEICENISAAAELKRTMVNMNEPSIPGVNKQETASTNEQKEHPSEKKQKGFWGSIFG